jgi:hypothetical protein
MREMLLMDKRLDVALLVLFIGVNEAAIPSVRIKESHSAGK